MRFRTLVAAGLAGLGCLAAGAPANAASSSAADAPIERSADFETSVAAAIDRGVAYLRTLQEDDGSFGSFPGQPCGLTALAYHTLRTCGVPAADPACVRAWDSLRREYEQARKAGLLRTYSAGLTMLAIADHALLVAPDRAKAKQSAPKAADADRAWMNELVAYFENCQSTGGAWSYGETQPYQKAAPTTTFDHSNTQYAAQGLRAASILGCDVKTDTWRRLAAHLVREQGPDGPVVTISPPRAKGETGADVRAKARGWTYRSPGARGADDSTGSMTAGSLASLVIARNELRARTTRDATLLRECEAAVASGIAWLALHLDVTRNPFESGWRSYWLYALERAGDLSGAERMGERDWYGEGARHLVAVQEPSGRWLDHAPEVAPQCWNLLFLRRGARVLESITSGGAAEPVSFQGSQDLADRDFEDLVDLAVARWRRSQRESERVELAASAAGAGERIVVPLLVRMASPDAAKRRAAHAILSRITGVAAPWNADDPDASRADGLAVYEAWYMARKGRLRCDPVRGLLVVE